MNGWSLGGDPGVGERNRDLETRQPELEAEFALLDMPAVAVGISKLNRIRICDFRMDLRRQQAGRPASETAGPAVLLCTNLDARQYISRVLSVGDPGQDA